MKKFIVLFFSFFLLQAQSFQDYKRNQLNSFKQYKENLNKEFELYKEELNKEFKHYKKTLSLYWSNPKLTTKKEFVEYSKDKKIRKSVNYENRTIKLEIITDNKRKAEKILKKHIAKLSIETTKEAFYKNPVLKKVNEKLKNKIKNIAITSPSNEQIVGDMIYQKTPNIDDIKNFVNKIFKNNTIKSKRSKIPKQKVYYINIKLPPNSILKKAKIYKYDVYSKSQKFNLSPSLIYAIIHTESSFNPMARSYVPAFGLMQIVPKTAGKDAYEMLYHEKKILSPSYLYNSKNNILIGSAYLYKLYYVYFKSIKDPISRLYCTIAAYNTGVGNVSCAFNSKTKDLAGRTICIRNRGDYNIKKAVRIINNYSSKEVYNHLIQNLRYEEARNYLKKVVKRLIMYSKTLKRNQLVKR